MLVLKLAKENTVYLEVKYVKLQGHCSWRVTLPLILNVLMPSEQLSTCSI